jgi:hypothetical protein
MCHEASKQVYTDGAIYHNNPIYIADQERKLLWPSLSDEPPDIILSIGTSYNPNSSRRRNLQRPSAPHLGVLNHAKQLLKIAIDHIASTLDSEKTWNDYIEVLNPQSADADRYVRINPQLSKDPPALDQVYMLEALQADVRQIMIAERDTIKKVARHLIATSFYFEVLGRPEETSESGITCRGQ